MLKSLVILLVFVSAVLSETTFNTVEPANVPETRPPYPDNGGNWGDVIFGRREDGDRLIIRQLHVNDIEKSDVTREWQTIWAKKIKITQLRFINIGRQRAWVSHPVITDKSASAFVFARRNEQYRLIIEVYAK